VPAFDTVINDTSLLNIFCTP